MPVYSDEQILPGADREFFSYNKPAMVTIKANGGSLAIEVAQGADWVAIEGSPFTADAAFHLEVANGQFRFTPSGGATYGVTG